MAMIKVSDYIAHFLAKQNTTHVFEVAGGMITHLIDSLFKLNTVHIISMHHEQAAAFAAEAYGRYTRRPGVAMATSGPGATNLLTGIASCYFDSSPALFITGQVNTHEQKKDKRIRQLGFQETDIISMAKPITKKTYQVEEAEQLPTLLNEAYQLTLSGRPGPVLIDIPMNIQNSLINPVKIPYLEKIISSSTLNDLKLPLLLNAIKSAKKPLILAGQGIHCSGARKEFLRFVELVKIPVVTSLLGLDCLHYAHPFRVGFIGSYGNRWANLALGEADLLIVLGSRLDIRQTGADINGFRKNKLIIHIDCDEHEINNRVKECITIVSDLKDFLTELLTQWANQLFTLPKIWLDTLHQLKEKWSDLEELKNIKGINPNKLMHELALHTQGDHAYVVDVGNHQMWAAQSLELKAQQAFITSGGMGAMGFALPAAIGYCLATSKKPVTVIVGDGAFQMNIQELQTIKRNHLPIKIIVINNQALGMIRQFQDNYFSGRYQSTYWGYTAPDFVKIAQAYGIAATSITLTEEITNGMNWLNNREGPMLLEIAIDPHTNVYPKIAFGRPITEMEPFSKPLAMEGT
jgi:acetolactate synthase-1/2/3 large subunit